MNIRPERAEDFQAIDEVVRTAFEGDREVKLVHDIRANDGYVPELSLVADDRDDIIGHIMLSYVALEDRRVLQLSPLAVKPRRQNHGIGSKLTEEALRLADERGEPLVLVLGHPAYYPRFGFERARPLGFEPPDPNMNSAWMVKLLSSYDPSLKGRVDFGPAFEEA